VKRSPQQNSCAQTPDEPCGSRTRFVAPDENAIDLPSADREGDSLLPLPCPPHEVTAPDPAMPVRRSFATMWSARR
jgi:hypothetical protein